MTLERDGVAWLALPKAAGGVTAAALLLVALFVVVFRGGSSSDPLAAVNPAGVQALIVEAHDERAGDPPLVPPAAHPPTHTALAVRNRNPLNIKYGGATQKYVAQGIASISRLLPRDGGRFLKFESAAAGFRAAVELLTSPLYTSLDLDSALKRWSNNGYGAEIVSRTSIDPASSTSTLEQARLTQLLRAMAVAEGYRSSALAEEISRAVADVPLVK